MIRTSMTLGIATLVLAAAGALADDKPRPNTSGAPEDLIGAYTIVSEERDGEKASSERVEGVTVRFAEDAIVVLDKDKKEVYAQTYKIDATKSPWKIKMKSKITPRGEQAGEAVTEGLIMKDGDTVKLIYAVPGGDTPTEFKTKEKQLMFVMKNTKKEK